MTQKTLDIVIPLIKEFEGLSLTAYYCSSNVLTIGYGATKLGGRPVKESDVITVHQAESQLRNDVASCIDVLSKSVPYWAQMNEYQQAALISFAFNVGFYFMEAQTGFSTIQRVLKNKQWDKVPEAFNLYTRANGLLLPGLVRRRRREGELWKSTLTQTGLKKESYLLLAIQDTYLYKNPFDPEEKNKVAVLWGRAYNAYKVEQKEEYGAYLKVFLSYGAGDWFIRKEDWAI